MSMIEAKGLTKFYGNFAAIRDLSFTVDEGEIVGLLGPNAAGKTTTMRIITGYMPPSNGSATVAGFDVFTQSLQARRLIGYLPETVPLYTELTVLQYLDFMAEIRDVPNRKKRVQETMVQCAIEHFADVLIAKLSKGYRQRLGLAQALVHNPRVLVLDEPTIGLDPKQVTEVRSLIRGLGNDRTVILSSHILSEVSHVCERVIIVNEGRVVAEDTPERLTRRLKGGQGLYLRLRDSSPQAVAVLRAVPGVRAVDGRAGVGFELECEPSDELRVRVADAVSANGLGLLEMRPSGMSLEDIFLKLTQTEHASSDPPQRATSAGRRLGRKSAGAGDRGGAHDAK